MSVIKRTKIDTFGMDVEKKILLYSIDPGIVENITDVSQKLANRNHRA